LDVQSEVTAHAALSGRKPVASNFSLRLLAGKWSDDVRIVFSGNKAKEYVAAAPANPSANPFPVTYLAAQHDTEIWLAPLAGSRLVVP
jgi:hypothetical protein